MTERRTKKKLLPAQPNISRRSTYEPNGSNGYLPTPEQHRLGGYETWLGTNRVEVQATVKIVDVLQKMFSELAETPQAVTAED